MSTKKSKPLSHDCGTKPPETRLTWTELARLSMLVQIDLKWIQDINRDSGQLDDMVQERQAIIAKLEQMRTEAWRRER